MTDFTKLSAEDLARVTTRDGWRVEIISTKGREPRPVIGYVGSSGGVLAWRANGTCGLVKTQSLYDLILPPAPDVFYLNRYERQISGDYRCAEDARANRGPSWLALYRITDDGENATIEVIERNRGAE